MLILMILKKIHRNCGQNLHDCRIKAMIAYFGSNEGRSAEAKGQEYGEKFGIEMEREINKAIAAAKFDEVGGQPHSEPSMDMLGK